MDDSSLDLLTPERVARLLDVDDAAGWSAADAAAALAHQLATPLLPDLFAAAGAGATRLAMATVAGRSARECTFEEALLAPQASVELLQCIKSWAKTVREQAGHPLAGAPATLLYYAAIARALCSGGKITALATDQLREGFAWSRRQPGAERLEAVFDDALRALENVVRR